MKYIVDYSLSDDKSFMWVRNEGFDFAVAVTHFSFVTANKKFKTVDFKVDQVKRAFQINDPLTVTFTGDCMCVCFTKKRKK